jgi:hypothetical protein
MRFSIGWLKIADAKLVEQPRWCERIASVRRTAGAQFAAAASIRVRIARISWNSG